MPNLETHIFGITIMWNVMVPGLVLMGLLFTCLGAYPFVEAWITGDRREHHLLQRPRNAPTRTGFGVAGMTAYGLLWIAGGNDLLATHFRMSIYAITWFMRFAIFVGPVLAFILTRRWCISLQRHDVESLLHGYESGVIVRSPTGGYSELHRPLNPERAYTLTAHDDDRVLQLTSAEDANGVRPPVGRIERLRARLSAFWYGDTVLRPTRTELVEARHHAEHDGHEEIAATENEDRTLESSVD
jgi:ubiquinol-cytochrome c reductase cytochrome b subunit